MFLKEIRPYYMSDRSCDEGGFLFGTQRKTENVLLLIKEVHRDGIV